ncbi:MAG: DUF21 domain-containing protein [Gammaproteobacteria bacterium]|nr:DUF21 domain-containing protein [Gammaproteobacteria bacterium]MYF37784.1 DUF21 domain-containing protein [Gammaproteobacteria bacterium]
MDLTLLLQVIAVVCLLLCSAYFSSSETAMMKLNPYRLKHMVLEGHRGARKANRMLRKTDRLLSVILIGNNLVNICAAVISANICKKLFGFLGAAAADTISIIALTIIVLIFAEIAPKTIAARRPETIAFPSTYVLDPLQRLLAPVVSLVNYLARLIVDLFVKKVKPEPSSLSLDELRTVVQRDSDIDLKRQAMLLGILDLGKATVNNIMIPYQKVKGVDLAKSKEAIVRDIVTAQHTRLPVYHEELNGVIGVFHMKRSGELFEAGEFDQEQFESELEHPTFVPSGTPLSTQLINFQQNKQRIAHVVDEYGTILGIVTLEDILEEVVGEFTTDINATVTDVYPQNDGTHVINGRALLREINVSLNWDLPLTGPRTMNGLILEHLEAIPDGPTCVKIETEEGQFIMETILVRENVIRSVRVAYEKIVRAPDEEDEETLDTEQEEKQ